MIGLHGENQALLRHAQKRLFKLRFIHHGPLGQRIDFIQQGFGHNHLIPARFVFELFVNAFTTNFIIGFNHALGAQNVRILVGVWNIDIGLTQKAMTIGHSIGIHTKRTHRQHIRTIEHHKAFHRTHELHIVLSRSARVNLIRHDFGNRQFACHFVQNAFQNLCQNRTFLCVGDEIHVLLAIVFNL